MRTIRDADGRDWNLSVTIGSIKRVRDLLKLNGESIDLLAPLSGNPPLVTRLFLDLCLLVDVIYCLCRPQAQERKVSDEDFGAAVSGEVAKAAYEAFFEELMDFFRKAGREEPAKMISGQLDILRQEWASAQTAFDAVAKEAPRILEDTARRLVDETLEKMNSQQDGGPGKTSTNSSDSPGESSPKD